MRVLIREVKWPHMPSDVTQRSHIWVVLKL